MRIGTGVHVGAALLATVLSTGTVGAQPTPESPPPAADEKTESARLHFQNGIKLYQDGNFAGALAEFEAAYALKPGASSLKNIALSQKALYRYAEAADTLKRVLDKHGAELSPDEQRAVQQAIDELSSLVGSIVLRITPSTARVTLDTRTVESAQWSSGISLNVGEHTVVADAPGYARASRTFRVASGQKNVPVELGLVATAGFVTVTARDPEAAIAVDNVAKAFERWRGPLEPGRHLVQVYRAGYTPFEQPIIVWQGNQPYVDPTRPEQPILLEVGQSTQVDAPGLEPAPAGETTDPRTGQPVRRQQRGWYGLAALTVLGMRDAPEGLDVDESEISGGSFGVRAGYRLWTPVAVEMLLEGSRHEVKDACDTQATPSLCGKEGQVTHDYTLDSVRLGPNMRIMSSGETLRFTSTLGAGAVRHAVKVGEPEGTIPASKTTAKVGKATGWDPYFLLEVGAQFNWGHILAEANVTAFIDGASNAKGTTSDGKAYEPFADTGGLVMVGLGLRGGWSEWSPSSAPPKLPVHH